MTNKKFSWIVTITFTLLNLLFIGVTIYRKKVSNSLLTYDNIPSNLIEKVILLADISSYIEVGIIIFLLILALYLFKKDNKKVIISISVIASVSLLFIILGMLISNFANIAFGNLIQQLSTSFIFILFFSLFIFIRYFFGKNEKKLLV